MRFCRYRSLAESIIFCSSASALFNFLRFVVVVCDRFRLRIVCTQFSLCRISALKHLGYVFLGMDIFGTNLSQAVVIASLILFHAELYST